MSPLSRLPLALSVFLAAACSGTHHPEPDVAEPQDAATDDASPTDDAGDDASAPEDVFVPPVGPGGGTVDRLRFGVFGDVRPTNMDETDGYPTAVITQVMDDFQAAGVTFVVATGDYMFASNGTTANAQLDLLASAERHYPSGFVFHGLGNHECTGGTTSNCPSAMETGQAQAYRDRLLNGLSGPYFDWTVHTSMGDAHFVSTAPNAWSSSQQAWLTRVLAQQAQYTIVIAHEPPTAPTVGPGSMAIEDAISARAGGVTLRLYGHTHDYRKIGANALIAGNAGAPLQDPGNDFYGYVTVEQQANGDLTVTAFQLGHPSMAVASWSVHPNGTSAP